MDRQNLIDCFQDTLEKSTSEPLAELTRAAAESSRIYEPGFRSERLYRLNQTRIQVVESDSFSAAAEYARDGSVAVLNFANPHYPGGGVTRGAVAQEECLCRSSNLYACLSHERVFEGFYQYHRTKTGHDFSDRLIYTRGVTVFKNAELLPRDLPREEWFRVDVITCAAPYLAKRAQVNRAVLLELLCSRIRNMFEAAIDQEARTLILGAFGCGAFCNPPEVVARAFHTVLQESRYHGAFERCVFAIKSSVGGDPYTVCPNLAAFQQEFLGSSGELEKLRYVGGGRETPDRFDVCMPGGRIRYRGSESRAYHAWREKNPYFGKQFSVLGDSISTLEGFHPRGNQVHYAAEICEKTGVTAPRDTWWGKVIDFFGGELLVNDSWSGSRVARSLEAADQFPSGCSRRRTDHLHGGNVLPDVILVEMGANDLIFGTPLVPGEDLNLDSADTCFSLAYGLMLNQLRNRYPQAEIWCINLGKTCIQGDPAFVSRETWVAGSMSDYNRQIANAAMAYGCRIVDLYDSGIAIDTVDGVHPTAKGMDAIAVQVVREMADEEGAAMLDCALEHEGIRGICRRCGKRLEPERPRMRPLQLRLRSGVTLMASKWQVTLGRSRECDLVVENGYVARSQATFTCREGQWYLRDNGSRNGTYLNGARLEQDREYPLKNNDIISFAKKEEAVFVE